MELKIRYESFDQFFRINKEDFQKVQSARSFLKSPKELSMTGDIFIESEKLTFYFLNLKNVVSDLLFGLSASVLDAKIEIKNQTALAYRELSGAQGDKKIQVEAVPNVLKANLIFNDLTDLKEYLENKYKDFELSYYYYRNISEGNIK